MSSSTFDIWVRTFKQNSRLVDPTERQAEAIRLAQELQEELKEELDIQLQAEEESEAIQAVRRIVEERIQYNENLLDFLQKESMETIKKFYRETYKTTLPPTCSREKIILALNPGIKNNIEGYKYILTHFKLDTSNLFFIDFLYTAVLKENNATLANSTYIERKNPAQEFIHIKNILNILRPFLSNSHEDFYNTIGKHSELKLILEALSAYAAMITSKLNSVGILLGKYKKFAIDSHFFSKLEKEISENTSDIRTFDSIINTTSKSITLTARFEKLEGLFNFMQETRKTHNKLHWALIYFNNVESIMQMSLSKERVPVLKKLEIPPSISRTGPTEDEGKTKEETPPEHLENPKRSSFDEAVERKQKEESEEQAKEIVEFRHKKEMELYQYKARLEASRSTRERVIAERNSLLRESVLPESEEKEKKELDEFEVQQLQYLARGLNSDHIKTLNDIFEGTSVCYKKIETMVLALSPRELIKSEKYPSFHLVEFNKSSHFSMYIPNTFKKWKKEDSDPRYGRIQLYNITPREMSTINSWCPHGGAHNRDVLSPFAQERCVEGFTRAGITPKRFDRLNITRMVEKHV